MIEWHCLSFNQLNVHQLYDLMKLRSDVFVVEQDCVYPDLDNKDRADDVHHLLGYHNGELIAYLRLLAPGVSYDSVSIGRVVVAPASRSNGTGHKLVIEGLKQAEKIWPAQKIEIGAQQHLTAFYIKHGFEQTSDMYLEDGIPHVDMQRI